MNPSPKTKPPRRAHGSVKRLAEGLGISTRHCSELLKSNMPDDLEAARKWRGENGTASAQADDSPAELRRRRIALITRQAEKISLELKTKNRELIPAGEVQEDAQRMYSCAKMRFLQLANDLPPRLCGLPESKIQVIIREAIIEILTELSDESSEIYNYPNPETESNQ